MHCLLVMLYTVYTTYCLRALRVFPIKYFMRITKTNFQHNANTNEDNMTTKGQQPTPTTIKGQQLTPTTIKGQQLTPITTKILVS